MFQDIVKFQSLLCGISEESNYDPSTFTGNVFCDVNRGDLYEGLHSWAWEKGEWVPHFSDYGKGVRSKS